MRFNESLSSLTLLAFLAVTACSAPSDDPAEPAAPSGEIMVTGCAEKGVTEGCWVLRDDQGTVYSFASGEVAPGQCYRVTGVEAMGICMQGTQLDVKKLEASETNCCEAK